MKPDSQGPAFLFKAGPQLYFKKSGKLTALKMIVGYMDVLLKATCFLSLAPGDSSAYPHEFA
jgi:hypothetical protein